MNVSAADWVLLILFALLLFVVLHQGKVIKRLETLAFIQGHINEDNHTEVLAIKKQLKWVSPAKNLVLGEPVRYE